jgi:hypothetical protein
VLGLHAWAEDPVPEVQTASPRANEGITMSESELEALLMEPAIQDGARRLTTVKPKKSKFDDALASWVAMNIVAWLQAWKGLQIVRVSRIWSVDTWDEDWDSTTDIDLLVGHDGIDEPFKLRTTIIGKGTLRLVIVKWVKGKEKQVWNQVGIFAHEHKGDDNGWFETMPTRPTAGTKLTF